MKKTILGIGLFLLVFSRCSTVYAGELNSYEKEVINTAKGRFEVDGKLYQVDNTYIDQLVAYLNSDGVDLTSDQKAEVISQMYASVEEGVSQGYLHAIEDQQEDTERSDNSAENIVTTQEAETGLIISRDNTNGTVISEIDPKGTSVDTNQEEFMIRGSIEDTIIKNTGFNLNRTFLIAVGAAALMLICMFEAIRSDYFAHTDE